MGATPSQYVLHVRVEACRRLLEHSDKNFTQIADATGFGGADSMRRAFVRLLGLTPQRYRRQTGATSSQLRDSHVDGVSRAALPFANELNRCFSFCRDRNLKHALH